MSQIGSSIKQRLKANVSLTLALIFVVGYPSQVLAQQPNLFQRIISIFRPRTSLGAPVGRVRGGAGRGRCPALEVIETVELPLIALVPAQLNPEAKQQSSQTTASPQLVWGTTVEAYPTFWFYIPYSLNEQSELQFAKFVLLDEKKHIVGKPIYVRLPEKPSIVGLTLPNNVQLLENKQYQWYFSIICDARKPSRNPSVTGWIEKISPPQTLSGDFDYIREGIWYDLVTRIAERRGVTYQTQSEAVPLNTEQSITVPQFQNQNQFQDDWIGLFQFLVRNNKLVEDTLALNLSEDRIARNLSDYTLALNLSEAPIVKLTPVSENEVQSQ